jgi:hypothetical protein
MCYYSTRSDPYFLLGPLKIEVQYPSPHPIIVFHDVVTDAGQRPILNFTPRGKLWPPGVKLVP